MKRRLPEFGVFPKDRINLFVPETLGPKTNPQPGQEVRLRETWELHSFDALIPDIDGIREAVNYLDL